MNFKYYYFKIFILIILTIIVLFALFKEIEVVVTGKGQTIINESDVIIKSPISGFIESVYVSQGQTVSTNQPLLLLKNIEEDYQYKQLTDKLEFKTRQREEAIRETCFLVDKDTFSLTDPVSFFSQSCTNITLKPTAGVIYIKQFYEDYLLELDYKNQVKDLNTLLKEEFETKKSSLIKQRNALQRGRAETVRFYDLEVSISDLNSEITRFNIGLKDLDKRISDKKHYFEMRRSERILALEERLQNLDEEILDIQGRKSYLERKKEVSKIRSPIDGNILKRSENVSEGVYIEQGSILMTLKKAGFSREVEARFDTKYRHFLSVGMPVKLKITSPGYLEVFNGTILEISSDAISDETEANVKYYRVIVKPDERFDKLSLDLGIDVEVYIIEDKVTPMIYILSVIPSFNKISVW